MKVVVTGGAGFIGSHLAEGLAAKGHEVTVLDNLSVGDQNLPFLEKAGIKFIKGDVSKREDVDAALKGMDAVFHLAALNRAGRSIEHPRQAHEWNVYGTFNIFEAGRENKLKKIVFISSSSVLGGSGDEILQEDRKLNPLHPYAVGKAAGELYGKVYSEIYGMDITTLRYFSIYGPRQRGDIGYAAVIPKFVQLASEGKALTVYGDGEQTRNFTYIDDVVQATIKALDSKEASGKIIHVANTNEYSILDIVDAVRKTTGVDAPVEFKPLPPGDPKRNFPDLSVAEKALGWDPQYPLEKGIQNYVNWFNSVKS